MMKKIILCLVFTLMPLWSWAADVDVDVDNNGYVDIAYGGTNAATADNARTALGLGATSNPTFNSVNITGSNIASSNRQVTKVWTAGLGYTANETSVIYNGKHYICVSTHTADADFAVDLAAGRWTVGTLGNLTIYNQDAEPAEPCTDGNLWVDTNGTSGARLNTCEETVWVAQAGGGGDDLGDATASDVIALFNTGTCSGYLKSDGTCDTPSGAAHDAVTLDTETAAIFSLSTQQITLDSQTANYIFAAPNGSAGDPTFRAMVDADIPSTIARDTEIPTDATISTSAVSTNDASTTKHGWLMMATAPAAGLRNIVAIDNAETSYKNTSLFDATAPSTQAMGDSASAGTAMTAARRDHKHAMPAAQTATTTAFTPNGSIAASNVQAAIQEVRDEAGGGTPGGSDTQVQFNDSSAFGGDAGLTYNKTTDTLTAGKYATSAPDGDRYSTLPNNTTGLEPTGAEVINGLYTYLNAIYLVENSTKMGRVMTSGNIDDTPADGDTANVPSSNALVDGLAGKQNSDADLTTWAGVTPGTGVATFLTTPSGANLASALTSALPTTDGGTGVANGSNNTITFTGNYTLGVTLSGNTAITLPTSGTLIASGGAIGAATATTPSANDNDTSVATTAFVTGEVKKKYVSGTEADFYGTLLDPAAIYAVDGTNHAVTIANNVPAAFTITEINVSCDADPTTEITLTFQHKTAGVGYGSPTTIEAVATTNGVATITTGFDDATIPAGTKLFMTLSNPDAALNECSWQIEGDWD